MNTRILSSLRIALFPLLIILLVLALVQPQSSVLAAPVLTITPLTWNIIGLDSNNVNVGPNHFPVGTRVCNTGDMAATNVVATFNWDSSNSFINIRPGTSSALSIASLANGTCTDFYFEVQVTRNASAYDTTRNYHITVTADGGLSASTPTPRVLYVEHLISQNRNTVSDVRYGTSLASLTSVANGGTMTLLVGNTYYIRLVGATATQGYEQIENFINFPNTVFQVLSVDTTYTAESSSNMSPPYDKLYGDACVWENDPNSPNYRACLGVGKAGGGVTVTYQVKILSVGSTNPEPLSTLIYDFSGSSFHYNSDFGVSTRYAYILDPSVVTISKNFNPDPTTNGGISTLTFTLTNPTPVTLTGLNFTDTLPTTPGAMTVASTPNASTTGCGSPTFAPTAGAASLSFSNGSLAPNSSCTIKVNVTVPVTGTYTNTSSNLFIDTLDTGNFATDTLTVNTSSTPAPVCGLDIAQWTFPAGFNTTSPAVSSGAGTASPGAGIVSTAFSEGTNSWGSSGAVATGATLDTSNDDYVQFSINTTGYSSVSLTFDAARKNIPNSPRGIAVYFSSSTGNDPNEPNAALYANATALPTGTTTFSSFGSFTFTPTANTMYVRIYFFNAGNTAAGSDIFVDNVTFTGCAVPNPPTITKAFSSNPIAVNATSTLTFTLSNSNSIDLTGVTFTDALPTGLQVAATPAATTTCGGTPTWAPAAGATNLTFGSPTGATIPANGSCTVSVNITGTASGSYQNISGFISSTNGGTNTGSTGSATASLTVLQPPSMSKLFAPNPILSGGTSTLTFTITNPNLNNDLTGVTFSDTYPSGLVNTTPASTSNSCAGTVSAVAGTNNVSLSAGSVAAGGTCTVTVNVTAASTGNYANTSGAVSSTNGGTGNTASNTLTVNAPNPAIALLKQVSTTATGPWTSFVAVATGANVYYQFTVENAGDVPLTSISISDSSLPSAATACNSTWTDPLPVAVAGNDNHIDTCVVGPIAAVSGSNPNTATASGTYNSTTYNDTSSATYATTGLTLDKTATETSFTTAGDLLHYSYLVTNSGFAPLPGPATITDDKVTVTCPAVSTVGDNDAYLDRNESITCTATYTVVNADVTNGSVTNTASATVGGVTSNQDGHTVNILRPDLAVSKSNNVSDSVSQNGTFNWTITVTNSGIADALFADTNVIMSDLLPGVAGYYPQGALTVTNGSTPPTGTVDCSITGTDLGCAADGPVTLPVNGSFSVIFAVTPTASGSLENTATVDPNNNIIEISEANNTASDTVTVIAPPLIEKQFIPETIAVDEVSTLTFTIFNTNTGIDLTGVAFSDSLPSGLQVASPANISVSGCGTPTFAPVAADTTLTFSDGTIAASGACTISVDVLATTSGIKNNTSGAVSSTNGGTGNTASYTLTVVAAPSITKAFSPDLIALNGTSTLTLTITNPNAGTPLTGVGFTDTFPSGLQVASTPNGTISGCGSPTFSPAAGATSLSFSGGTVAGGGTCTVSVDVTATTGGMKNNTTSNITSTNGGAGNAASDTLDVVSAAKTIVSTSEASTDLVSGFERIAIGEVIHYRLMTDLPEGTWTNVQITDAIDTGIQFLNDGTATVSYTCDGSCTNTTFTITPATFSSSTDPTFSLGTVTNPDNDANAEYVIVEFNALVLNILSNAAGGLTRNNSYRFSIDGTTITSPNVGVRVVEPSITNLTKSVSPASGPYYPGDTITYTLAYSNGATGVNRATAFDVFVTDVLSINLDLQGVSVAAPTGSTVTDTSTTGVGGVVRILVDQVPPVVDIASGPTDVTITVTAQIVNTAPGSTLSNTANLTYTSLPGGVTTGDTNGTCPNVTGSCPPGTSGSITGERNGTGGSPNSYTDTSMADVIVTPSADLSVTKTDGSATYTQGGTVIYTVTVLNNGPSDVTDVNISDTKPSQITTWAWVCTAESGGANGCTASASSSNDFTDTVNLPSGGSIVYTVTASIDPAATGDLINTATVSVPAGVTDSTPVNNSSTDTNTLLAEPELTITKSATESSYSTVGDILHYSYLLTNTGNVTLDGPFTVADDQSADETCPVTATLTPEASITCTATYTVTQADLDAGNVTNVASAGGSFGGNPVNSATDTETVNATQSPALTIVKTVTETSYSTVGTVLHYSYTLTNSGNVTLDGPFTVTDDQSSDEACPVTATLLPNSSIVCTATYTITQADLDSGSVTNIASGHGSFDGDPVDSSTDTETINADQNPALTIAKSVTETSYASVGDVLHYSYLVTNTGNVTLDGPFTVTDDRSTDESCPVTASLAPGANITCTATHMVTQADLDAGSVTNLASAHGSFGGNPVDSGTDTETVNADQNPALTIAKNETSTGPYGVNDVITYSVVVTNIGNVSLTNVVVSDPVLTPNSNTCANVSPNGTCTLSGSYTITQADMDAGSFANTTSVTDNEVCPAAGPVTCEDSLTVTFQQNPAVNIAKTPATQSVLSGETATFTLAVTNTGNVTLTNVNVTDADCTTGPTFTGGDTNNDNQLQITETWTYSCSTANVTADFINTAEVTTAEDANDSDTASVTVIIPQADLSLDKSVSDSTPLVATDITFTLSVRNSGPDPATGVEVTDVIPSGFSYVSDNGGVAYNSGTGVWTVGNLAVGETKSLTITVTVNLTGPYTNEAEITASDVVDPDSSPNNNSTTEDDDTSVPVTPSQNDPSGLTKTISDSNQAFTTQPNVAIGEIVTYEVSVNVPPGVFEDAQLVDTMNRGLSFMECSSITGAGLTTSVAGGFSSICSTPTVDDAGGGTTVDVGRRVTFDFGALTNITGSDQSLLITYQAVVLDSLANVSGVNLRNSAQWTWGSSGNLGPARVTVRVAEPDLSISKTANMSLVSVGSEVTITLIIRHTPNSETNAYDALVTDVLPAELQYVAGSLECSSGAQDADVTCSESGGTITAEWSNLLLGGGNGQLTFRVTVVSLPSGGISNTANVAWSSLPGDVSALQNPNIFSTERDYDPASQIDVYGASDTLVLNASANPSGGRRLPDTGFAPNVITDLRDIPFEPYTQTGGITLEIPSLGVNIAIVGVPLKNGEWNVSWLGKQAGWLEGSAFPSWNGNSVLTSHVYLPNGLPGPFVNLSRLKYGDKIIIHAFGQKYQFEVRTNTLIEPDDTSVLKHEEKPWLTLVTCRDYDEKTNAYRQRVAVRAVLISVTWE